MTRETAVVAVVAAAAGAAATRVLSRRDHRPIAGGLVTALAAWLLFTQHLRGGGTTYAVAAFGGAGVGLLGRAATPRRIPATLTAIVTAVAAVAVTSWIGANSASVDWFGATVSHGPRSGRQVAITFDDGPDVPYSLDVRDILDRYGVKATFFTVGKALDARPDVSRALLDDGQLLANHSYHHDGWRWLDPRYPELDRTQQAFRRDLGICPALYRPPHGQHTPFIARAVGGKGMTMVTWDVSARDWSSHDGAAVARRVLATAKPGSIILLHDGIDGTVTADRSVLLTALPLVLDGLRQKGLQPVRLDQLLGRPGYLPHCPGAGATPGGATPAAPTAG